jgi:hypothetical protein
MDVSTRHGPEFNESGRGRFGPDPVSLLGDGVTRVALKPAMLLDFILSNRDALLAEISRDHGLSDGGSG